MIGYHYTALANWTRIQTEGMKAYPLNKPEIQPYVSSDKGIFLFVDDTWDDSFDEIGCVLFQAMLKQTLDIAYLAVEYEHEDEIVVPPSWTIPEDNFTLDHTGSLGPVTGAPSDSWPYHVNRPMTVLRGPVPPEKVTLEKTYDLRNLLRDVPYERPVHPFMDLWPSKEIRLELPAGAGRSDSGA